MAHDEPEDVAPEADGDEAAGDEAASDEAAGAENDGAAPAAAEPEAQPDDGGDVAGRDPDAIAREIEQTRAELADTIDAIADRISPKRAAARGAQAVKAQVSAARGKVAGDPAAAGSEPGDRDADESRTGLSGVDERSLAVLAPKIAAAGAVLLIVVFWLRRRSR
jgi:hypothetical protein